MYSTDLVKKTHQQPPSMTLNDSAISQSTCLSNTSFNYSKKGTHIFNSNICHLMPKLGEVSLFIMQWADYVTYNTGIINLLFTCLLV